MSDRTDDLKYQTRLHKVGSTYYYRQKVPEDLLWHYGKREIKLSLHTKEVSEGARRARAQAVKLDAEFECLRQQRAAAAGDQLHRVERLSDGEIEQICGLWMNQVLAADEARRREGLDDEEFDAMASQFKQTEQELKSALARGKLETIKPVLHSFFYMLQLDLDCDDENYRRLAYAFLQTLKRTVEYQKARHDGQVVPTGEVAPPQQSLNLATGFRRPTFDDLLKHWKSCVKDRRPRTIMDFERAVREFDDFTGRKPVPVLKKGDFVGFRNHLLNVANKNHKTVAKKLDFLHAILNRAFKDDLISANPAAGVEVVTPKVEAITRLPWSVDEMNALFETPVFAERERPKAGGGEAAVWLPLLGIFTGARLEELGQLKVTDVREEKGVCWYLTITDLEELEGEGESGNVSTGRKMKQTVKTTASRRRVPLHAELIRVGFLHYWQAIKDAGESLLFPLLTPNIVGELTGNWSKWFGRYLRVNNIIDSKLVFHSLRHSFKRACRECGISEELHDRLTGHAGGGVGRTYDQTDYPLKPLAAAIKRLKYPGLKVPVIVSGQGDA